VSADRAPSRPAIDEFLERLPGLALIVGKGGVGKTTCAIGIAARLAAAGNRTLLVATDPAGSLGPALETTLVPGEASAVLGANGLSAMQLDPASARAAFLQRWREVLVTIIDRGTYLDSEEIRGLVDTSFPGADEIFGLLVLTQLLSADAPQRWSRFAVDTAPTGHTLRLLALPDTFAAMISLLDSMQAKHRFMVSALTHRYRRDAADDFLDEMRRTLGELREALGNSERAGAVLVTRSERVVVNETVRYAQALRGLGISIVAVVVDSMEGAISEDAVAMAELSEIAPAGGLFGLPRVEPPPIGLRACSLALGALTPLGVAAGRRKSMVGARERFRNEHRSKVDSKAGGPPSAGPDSAGQRKRILRLLRTLTIVGGKGGVGKTTVSCALAIISALEGAKGVDDTLLVSTDPAPSIGDALGITGTPWAHKGPESLNTAPGLHVWQMDAGSGFDELRDRYRHRVDSFFDAITGGSVDIAHDRAILRDLLSLAPPGIDELYALASLGELLEAGRYARVIIDPAPTGHLMRLLELPSLALEWSHRLMRLIMKYREVAGLVDAAQDLVTFSRRTRTLDRLLHDSTRAGAVLVSLDEPAVTAETQRLSAALGATGIAILGEVRNRVAASSHTSVAPEQLARVVFFAPEMDPPPIGVAAIRDWCERWQREDSR
jgi:arsenite-transporting ATPase